MLAGAIIITKFLGLAVSKLTDTLSRSLAARIHRLTYRSAETPKNVVVIGASFAGYHAARLLANSLPSGYRVVVVEKNSHFNFTWSFPRFSVVGGNEWKAFIPYSSYLRGAPEGSYEFIRDAVDDVSKTTVVLRSGREIEYEYLVVTTGCQADAPSRLNAEERDDAVKILRGLQEKIREASDFVVVGGGPAGVELATDAKALYPKKNVTLIHSRKRLLHAFGSRLHDTAMEELNRLGVRVVLGERPVLTDESSGSIALSSGETVDFDLVVKCTGQKPSSSVVAKLAPNAISQSGYVKVKPTLQIEDDDLRNVYAAGDVAEAGGYGNSRSTMEQATVVADNIVLAIKGKPLIKYHAQWWEGGIELTLGLNKSMMHLEDGKRDIQFNRKSADMVGKCAQCWKYFNAGPLPNADPVV
ncbi:putative disulfide oxidoreductase [Mytilinidion resinicola]|uniref:Disulfide oxidoreductase n=1 Tax=Mytilinidion resinicola TaxID=574789 RepID=A0A6A6Z5C6_9PEZI|nr:putative disulfide oxidoreductase [Mytilinidion resinicola]KAF2816296.1 putative disulfide oxidoreductase [Mytilinidion resinicola]